ncbi:MAG: hypothetical protein OXB94_14100 [Nitrospira sp.]|nr:hypothetical protein [Nitrospira sp.]
MLENFHLAAIIKQGAQTRMLQIPLHQALQDSLTADWQSQYEAFVDQIDEIDFNVGYQPEEHERFCLADYELPDWLAKENSQTIANLDTINENEASLDSIRGTVAFARNDQGAELVLFQNFTPSQVIRPSKSLFLEAGTYKSIKRPGLTLGDRLSAVYQRAECKLLFHKFRAVNTFLPLSDFYKEASEQEIREILNHKLLEAEDANALATSANQWFRKRFTMLKDSGVLDRFSAKDIQSRSKGYDVSIQILKGKIVFPSDKLVAKKLLQFLNEELFRGAITKTLYETNSKRQTDK